MPGQPGPEIAEEYLMLIHSTHVWGVGYPHFNVKAGIRYDHGNPGDEPVFIEITFRERRGHLQVDRPPSLYAAMWMSHRIMDSLDKLADELLMGYGAPEG